MRVSRNCGNCRAIKRRCDQQRPHCGQCIRLHEKCPGYRDEWELVFRDQTKHTIRRSREARAKRDTSVQQTPPFTISPSIEEIGVNYFLHNFIVGGQSSSHGYLNYVPSVYRADGEHPTLVASMAAVGLSALAHSVQQPELLRQARTKYSEAIRSVNTALASPVESVKDSTLMAIISMGLFEHPFNSESWHRHTQGAAALLILRGKGQFSSKAAIHMFNQVRADMVVSCMQGLQPFPEDMRELQDEASKYVGPSSTFWLLGVLATRCVDLLWGVTYKKGKKEQAAFLEEAVLLQAQLSDVFEALSIQEPFSTCQETGADSELIYNDRFDLYESSWSIRVWNNARIIRIVACEISLYLLNKALVQDLTPEIRAHLILKRQETLYVLSQMGDAILATVPQALGAVQMAFESPPVTNFSSHAIVPGGNLLTWPLYTVGKSPVTDTKTRKWIIRRLQSIRQNAGIEVALQLLEEIAELARATD